MISLWQTQNLSRPIQDISWQHKIQTDTSCTRKLLALALVSVQGPIKTSSQCIAMEKVAADCKLRGEECNHLTFYHLYISSKCYYGVVKINDTLMRQWWAEKGRGSCKVVALIGNTFLLFSFLLHRPGCIPKNPF